MIDLQKDLEIFKFTRKGEIIINEKSNHPVFKYDESEKLEGNVYMWIEEIKEKPSRILYIGKAGKTVLKRCREHIGGFRGGSNKGKKNAKELLKILETGTKIGIYSRHSEIKTVLGQSNISLCEAEEKALINRYKDTFQLFNKG